jgi:hypothetical protein
MKNTLPLIIIGIAAFLGYQNFISHKSSSRTVRYLEASKSLPSSPSYEIDKLYKNRKSNVQVRGKGKVVKILSDDLKGSKHQRFIIRYSPSLTFLMAHNIDIAPRVRNIKIGDIVEFYGEYAWNSKGGVVHWTHKDPQKKHIDGYLKFKNRKYQ